MSNSNTSIFRGIPSWVLELARYRVSVIALINLNPFSWCWTGDCGKHRDGDDCDVYVSLLPLTLIFGIYRQPEE